jgi:Putative Zn-dependent protease, contains TPR repeats
VPNEAAQEWYDIGNAWLDKGEWEKAGKAYSRALAKYPRFAGASFNLARALAAGGDYQASLRVLNELALRDPKNARVIAARAYDLYKLDKPKEALEAYRAALELDPYAPDAVYNASLLELAAGDAQSAASDLDRLTSAKPEDGQAFLLLGRARDKTGDAKAALAAYEKAVELGKADADAEERLGALYEADRRFSDAMDALAAATKADPKRASAWFSLARLRLVVASDGAGGLSALRSAMDCGFYDEVAAQALLDEPNLVEREKVFALLKANYLTGESQ